VDEFGIRTLLSSNAFKGGGRDNVARYTPNVSNLTGILRSIMILFSSGISGIFG